MARGTAYTYWHSPCRAAMALVEGAWTDDADYTKGGYFASELDADVFVAIDTTGDFRVKKATASTDVVIGKMISEPQGEHVENARFGNVLLFGDYILEVEIDTASDAIAPGDSVVFSKLGGSYSEGVWKKSQGTTISLTGSADSTQSVGNGTLALASTSASASIATATVIPVMFGYKNVAENLSIVVDG